MIKNVVLDMGNVLLDFSPERILKRFFDTEEERMIIKQELLEAPEWVMGDKGEITNLERYEKIKERVPEQLHEKLFECIQQWGNTMTPVEGAKDFVKYIRNRGYRVYILSNACNAFYEYFPREFVLDTFDGVVVSSDVHMIKPYKEIYEYLLEKYDLQPEESLFIDDRLENVEGAKAVGMHAMVFDNNFQEVVQSYQL